MTTVKWGILAMLAFAFIACDDSNSKNNEGTVFKPIKENLVGRWQCEEAFIVGDNGK